MTHCSRDAVVFATLSFRLLAVLMAVMPGCLLSRSVTTSTSNRSAFGSRHGFWSGSCRCAVLRPS